MSVFVFTEKDLNRRKILAAGWYSAEVTGVSEKANNKGTGINTVVSLHIAKGTKDEKEQDVFFPQDYPGLAIPFIEAVYDCQVESGKQYRLDGSIIGAKLQVELDRSILPKKSPAARDVLVNGIIRYATKDTDTSVPF